MKTSQQSLLWILFFAFSAFLLSSCNKNAESFSTEDTETSNNESTQETTTSELDDMTTSLLESSPDAGTFPGGRTQLADDRISCDGTTITFSNVNIEKTEGKVTIVFGPDGCTDKKGNTRKGTIIIRWTGGKWYNVGSYVTVTLENYSINGVQISGTRTTSCKAFTASTATNAASVTITWTLTGSHTATWPDGTTATRKINKTRKWEHSATEDKFIITNGPSAVNAAEGTNRRGKEYKVYITSPLVYLGSCAKTSKVFIPVKGEKVITSISSAGKAKSLTVNYGNGACDNTYTVTSGTMVKTLTVSNDGM